MALKTYLRKIEITDIYDQEAAKAAADISKNEINKLFGKVRGDVTHDEGGEDNTSDKNYTVREKRKAKKIDVMSAVSNTGDKLGLTLERFGFFATSKVRVGWIPPQI